MPSRQTFIGSSASVSRARGRPKRIHSGQHVVLSQDQRSSPWLGCFEECKRENVNSRVSSSLHDISPNHALSRHHLRIRECSITRKIDPEVCNEGSLPGQSRIDRQTGRTSLSRPPVDRPMPTPKPAQDAHPCPTCNRRSRLARRFRPQTHRYVMRGDACRPSSAKAARETSLMAERHACEW